MEQQVEFEITVEANAKWVEDFGEKKHISLDSVVIAGVEVNVSELPKALRIKLEEYAMDMVEG